MKSVFVFKKLFIDEFGFNINDMAFDTPYNVEEANIAILAFDEENNSDAYAKVISAIKKPCKNSVVIKLENKEDWEEPVDAKHLYAIYKSNNKVDYCYAEDLVKDTLNSGIADDINVYIGDENSNEELKDFSIITFNHKVHGKSVGTIGIIGPKRMDYSKVISILKYINRKMNQGGLLGEGKKED